VSHVLVLGWPAWIRPSQAAIRA